MKEQLEHWKPALILKRKKQMTNEEWLKWRRGGIGSSDAPIVLGISPWRTPHELWQDKVYGNLVQLENSSMTRGKELEDVARREFEKEMHVTVFPKNVMHKASDWIRASLDGIDMEGKIMVEIKCPNRDDHFVALNKMVPEKYIPQVQHQLLVTGLDGMYYYSFDGKKGAIVEVARDNAYIASMLEEEQKFWDLVLSKTPPPLTDRDFLSMEGNEEWRRLSEDWLALADNLEYFEQKEKETRSALISLSSDRNAKGNGVKICKSICNGAIDFKQVMADHPEIDWESYRKNPFTKWTFRTIKENE
jgi:putative phage-type endonuclease